MLYQRTDDEMHGIERCSSEAFVPQFLATRGKWINWCREWRFGSINETKSLGEMQCMPSTITIFTVRVRCGIIERLVSGWSPFWLLLLFAWRPYRSMDIYLVMNKRTNVCVRYKLSTRLPRRPFGRMRITRPLIDFSLQNSGIFNLQSRCSSISR